MGRTAAKASPLDDIETDTEPAGESPAAPDMFESILEKLAGTSQGASKMDPTMLMMMQMQERAAREEKEARREAAESRRANLTLLATVLAPALPALIEKLFGKKSDPAMDKLMDVVLAKTNNNDMIKSTLDMVTNSTQVALKSALDSVATVSAAKDQMHAENLERLRDQISNNSDKGEATTGNTFIDGMREARLLIEKTGIMGAPVQPAQPAQPVAIHPEQLTGAADTGPLRLENSKPRKSPIATLISGLHGVHTGGASMTPIQRARVRAGLVTVCLSDEALCKAIMDGDQPSLMTMGQPVVMADKVLADWILTPGVEAWIGVYLAKQLGPCLDEAINAESYANEPEEPGDDEAAGQVAESEQDPATLSDIAVG